MSGKDSNPVAPPQSDQDRDRVIEEQRQTIQELEALLSERSEELKASQRRYHRVFQRTKDTILFTTPSGELIDINQAGLDLYDYESLEQIQEIDLATQMWANAKDRDEFIEELKEFGYVQNFETEHLNRSGEIISVVGTCVVVSNEDGSIAELLTILRDISEQKRLQNELERLARTDSMTGLANRIVFRERLDLAVMQTRRDGQLFALMMLDIDRLKQINDTHGHPAGDAVIKEVAHRFQDKLREYDLLARFGGDEFALLLSNLPGKEKASEMAERLVACLADPIDFDGISIQTSTSIGIALPEGDRDLDQMLQLADRALYRAKHRGRDRFSF